MKTIILSFVLIIAMSKGFLLPSLNNVTSVLSNEKEEIMTDISGQLLPFLNKIPPGQEMPYGFNNREEFAKAHTGDIIYKVFTFANDNQSGDLNIISTGEYRVPVVVDKTYRALLTVTKIDAKWYIVDFGACVLAKEFDEFEKTASPTAESEGVLLRIYEMNCDFICVKKRDSLIDSCRFYPMQSAKNILSEKRKTIEPYYEKSQLIKLITNN
jgi:hypothetical protein